MVSLCRATKIRTAAVIATAFLLGAPSIADAQTTGTVRVRVAKAGFIVGVGGGTGTLTFRGKTYRFRADGLSAGTIGVAQADLYGTASNLRTVADFPGTYSAVGAGIAVAGGGRSIRLQNARGVVMDLRGTQAGFEASLGVGGVTVTMQ
jgi:hypothetical protein